MYGKTLDAGKAEALFAAYKYCDCTSPDCQSKTKQKWPHPRPAKSKATPATASATTESATPATPPESATSATPAALPSSTADLESVQLLGLILTAKPALAFMAEAAREAIHALGLGSDVTSLLDEPLDSRKIAHAYDLARQHEGMPRGHALRHIRDT